MSESQTTPDIRTFQAEDLITERNWPSPLWVIEHELPDRTGHGCFHDCEWGDGIAAFQTQEEIDRFGKANELDGRRVVKSLDQLIALAREKDLPVLGVLLMTAPKPKEFRVLDAVYVR